MRWPIVVVTLIATAGTAAASPIATAFAGGVGGGGDTLGGVLGARLGLRTDPDAWGGHVEAAVLRYAGFGPHTGARGYHAAIAVQRRTPDRRFLAFGGVAVEARSARAQDTGAEARLTALGPTVGAGIRVGPLALELALAVPLITLAQAGDPAAELTAGAQLMLTVGVGRP